VTDPSDKAVDTEQRLNALIARLPSTKRNSSTTTIVSTSPTDLGAAIGLQETVGPGIWRFRWHLMCVPNGAGTPAGNSRFRLATPAFSDGGYTLASLGNGPNVTARFDNTSGGGVFMTGPSMNATAVPVYIIDIEGTCTFTAQGILTVQAALTAATDSQYVIAIGSSLDTWQVG
jgi:hypothetical protein